MNKDTVSGAVKKVTGTVENAYGKATGDKATEHKGNAKKVVGDAQQAYGKVKDDLK